MVCFGSLGDVLLSKGMKQIGEASFSSPAAFLDVLYRAFSSATVWAGILSLILFFVCYVLVLTWADFSYVLPASATSYALVPLLGVALLGERVSAVRWAGIALIFLGVMLVGSTNPKSSAAVPAAIAEGHGSN